MFGRFSSSLPSSFSRKTQTIKGGSLLLEELKHKKCGFIVKPDECEIDTHVIKKFCGNECIQVRSRCSKTMNLFRSKTKFIIGMSGLPSFI